MSSLLPFQRSPFLWGCVATGHGKRGRGTACVSGADNGAFHVFKEMVENNGFQVDDRSGCLKCKYGGKKKMVKELNGESDKLEVLWDDGLGTANLKDYLDAAKGMINPDGGPPRWFCPVECGHTLKDSPVLLFLPGMDGVGMGLIVHHRPLGRAFQVWCLHIPVNDRTSFQGLVNFVEQTVWHEHALSPDKPIYLVGDSFGGCLALSVAARNPTIDLVLILSNPATSVGRSQLQPLFPLLEEAWLDELQIGIPFLLGFFLGEPLKFALVGVDGMLPPPQILHNLSENIMGLLPHLSVVADIMPKDSLVWKLKLLKSAAAYTNSRIHAVKAEVLILASGKDNVLPSGDEAARLSNLLENCKVRYFKNNGHALLLEDGINILTVIKCTDKYRHSRRIDYVSDFLPPSKSEFKFAIDEASRWFQLWTSPVMFSTLADGRIVNGLSGVPNEGPVVLVGYHMLMGMEIVAITEGFLREKKVMLRGLAHPELFSSSLENPGSEVSFFDFAKVFGGVPVTASNFYKLLKTKSYVLLYPGGPREALHRKGEEYTLFWPDGAEFVRMAARFGAKIVPFGVVGEDDVVELLLDYEDLLKIPVVGESIRQIAREQKKARAYKEGEAANEDLFIPVIAPKAPGRFYFLFGRPIETKGKEELLKDKSNVRELYLRIKSDVELSMRYLRRKREEDPYRNVVDRLIYRVVYAPVSEVPTFSP